MIIQNEELFVFIARQNKIQNRFNSNIHQWTHNYKHNSACTNQVFELMKLSWEGISGIAIINPDFYIYIICGSYALYLLHDVNI